MTGRLLPPFIYHRLCTSAPAVAQDNNTDLSSALPLPAPFRRRGRATRVPQVQVDLSISIFSKF